MVSVQVVLGRDVVAIDTQYPVTCLVVDSYGQLQAAFHTTSKVILV